MWIVKLALRRPYTFVVMSLLIAVLGILAGISMPTDIFPVIDIPVVSVIFSYTGISADEMAKRITTGFERGVTTSVNNIEHIESQSMPGNTVVRVYFHPEAKVELGVAQIGAMGQSVLRVMPPGLFPPSILQFNAASVPVLQLALSSKTMSEQLLYDYGQNFIRTQLATVQGASLPLPYGGRPRQIMVDLDPDALYSKGLSATDVSAAINAQNLIVPSGTAKIGPREYNVKLNSSPETAEEINDMPIKVVNGSVVLVKDVAQVHDGFAVQGNVVRHDGRRGALLTVLKNGAASTLDVIERVRTQLKAIQAGLPKELEITYLFDQSVFVRAAIANVMREAAVAGLLTALMILLFLGSWRSTLIVCISIPLSILTSLALLSITGQTVNVMTLGGLALAVGILVDDATVEVENIHRNLGQRKPILQAILDGAQQIAIPTFVATLSICIVFVTVVFLTGTAKYLFRPMALAVVYAMAASYLLSRTLVPTLARYLLPKEAEQHQLEEMGIAREGGFFWTVHSRFIQAFERLRDRYSSALAWALAHRKTVIAGFLIFALGSLGLLPFIGEDFFPAVDAGLLRLHVRAPSGTRVEETERWFAKVENTIRQVIPKEELATILDNIGLPAVGLNLAYSDTATIGPGDGEILVSLTPERHGPTAGYMKTLRRRLREEYPDLTFFFQPADMTNQILNFGLPAPMDIQIAGRNEKAALEIAREIQRRVEKVSGAADVHLHQVVDAPEIRVNVDRTKAAMMGLTQKDVASSMLVSLSSTTQTSPNFWLNPLNGVSYFVAVQTPTNRIESMADLERTTVTAGPNSPAQMLSNIATFGRDQATGVVNHYNAQPIFDVFANVQDRDLGGVATDVRTIMSDVERRLPAGIAVTLRGQAETMRSSFVRLGFGLLFAILLVYMLMVVNFQSWLDPFIILTALPGLLMGILWMLFATQTTISVPSLMGAIMSIGVATANSILIVTFANDQRRLGRNAKEAALMAGFTRLRPVIMTALAMVLGMLPISLGLGEGGEQNAPLGRAVIGGLMVATFATLFLVPVMYSLLRKKAPADFENLVPTYGGAHE